MSAKLGSRKARLGLMRLGAPSSTPFLSNLPSGLALEDRSTDLALIADGHGMALDPRSSSAITFESRNTELATVDRDTSLATEARDDKLTLADDERKLDLDG